MQIVPSNLVTSVLVLASPVGVGVVGSLLDLGGFGDWFCSLGGVVLLCLSRIKIGASW